MSANAFAIFASIGIGAIAGFFLDVPAFLICVVAPTLVSLGTALVASDGLNAWTLPIGWIAQQTAYVAALQATRPSAYRRLLARLRLFMDQ